MTAVRKYLNDKWGLGPGPQDSVLVLAITSQPPSRLGSSDDARAFLDTLVVAYSKDAGIDLSVFTTNTTASVDATEAVIVDIKAFAAFTEKQQALAREKLDMYAKYLDIDLEAGNKSATKMTDIVEDLQAQLHTWNLEHGETYASGVRPLFSLPKIRSFDSSWNWAAQDTVDLFFGIVTGTTHANDPETTRRTMQIANRANDRLLKIVNFLKDRSDSKREEGYIAAGKLFEHLLELVESVLAQNPIAREAERFNAPRTEIDRLGRIQYTEIPREEIRPQESHWKSERRRSSRTELDPAKNCIGLKTKRQHGWELSPGLTDVYFNSLKQFRKLTIPLSRKYVLLTGAGPNSIGSEILRRLLNEGAQVLVTTSSDISTTASYYQGIYAQEGARGSSLVVVPFNQGSQQDIKALISYIYDPDHGLGWDLDFIIPFAAISDNNILAQEVEKRGAWTFSQSEMAFYIMGLMTDPIVEHCQTEPLYADFSGGLDVIGELKPFLTGLRSQINSEARLISAIAKEDAVEAEMMNMNRRNTQTGSDAEVKKRANNRFDFPRLPTASELDPLRDLEGMINLDKVVVVTGFSEVGPLGNARTRWEVESKGQFSSEGAIEMARIMGLIESSSGIAMKNQAHTGWIDTKSGQPIDERDIKNKYEEFILEHTGIRVVEPDLVHGFDPDRKEVLQQVILENDLAPFEVSQETAMGFSREHQDKVNISPVKDSDQFTVYLRKGATIMIPKALKFNRTVAGQIPTGWDARIYGIPEDIITQVNRITLFTLVSTVEALLVSGITDPYELYEHIHVSEVGICVGSGAGGMGSLRQKHRERYLDKTVQNDILQETFINTTSAWVNMLLLSSTGPIRTPVGACATSIESLDTGYETIMSGKSKMCIVGGVDDLAEDEMCEFANMNATSNSTTEFAAGRTPKDMSRPTSSTRSGFMESQGCGLQIITTAQLAIDMGLPIHGIVALTATASDKIGRSVPAPGRGILSIARESHTAYQSPMLDLRYRKRKIESRNKQLKESKVLELSYLKSQRLALQESGSWTSTDELTYEGRLRDAEKESARQQSECLSSLSNLFYVGDNSIAPLRGALAVWGLTIDDLDVASFHGTSTKLNDRNESEVIQKQLSSLGRKEGNTIFSVFQKHLTGHPLGAAGAWMLNGGLQILNTGLVPGNRNADNVDLDLKVNDHILYSNHSIQTDGIKAVSITSFGFGQKGAQAIIVHPKYLYAALDDTTYNTYCSKVSSRQKRAYRQYHLAVATNTMFVAKDHPPYHHDQESIFIMDPESRLSAKDRPLFT